MASFILCTNHGDFHTEKMNECWVHDNKIYHKTLEGTLFLLFFQIFASKLAARHYERRLSQKVWDSWHSVIVDKWRSRVEKACQAKAQEVCINLTNDYESRIQSVSLYN